MYSSTRVVYFLSSVTGLHVQRSLRGALFVPFSQHSGLPVTFEWLHVRLISAHLPP